MAEHIPAETFPPGEFVKDELETRGWTQADLAGIMGRPVQAIGEIIAGKKAVTPETAQGLAAAFGTSAEFWLNLESAYRLSLTRQDTEDVEWRARLYSLAPINDMIRRKWIKDSKDPGTLEKELKRFFDVPSLDCEPEVRFAARMSGSYSEKPTPAQRAWICRAKQLGRAVGAAKFDQRAFEQGLPSVRDLIANDQDVRRVPRLLADLGVRLVLVEALPKTRIDGATLWVDRNTPVVAITMRYDRIDGFWHTLLHELIHVKYGDHSLDNDIVGDKRVPPTERPEEEQRADREAAEFLVPSHEIDTFILRVRPLFYKTKIIQFANRIRVHPGIIIGQLQFKGAIKYSHSRELLVKVRQPLTEAALSDGWGFAPPLGQV